MWGEFKDEDNLGKFRPPTIVRIEVDMVNQKIRVVWEQLQTAKRIALGPQQLTEHDHFDVFSAAQIAIKALEKQNPPFRFVHGDTVEVWEILNDGEPRLLATGAVSVTPFMCDACNSTESFDA